jgi:HEAT repeat protein
MSFLQKLFRPDVEKLKAKGDIAGLVRALGYDETQLQQAAAKALETTGSAAVEPLLVAVRSKKDAFQINLIIETLSKINPHPTERLVAALQDENKSVQEVAVEALGKIGEKSAVEPLIAVLPQYGGSQKRGVVEALGMIGDRNAMEPVILTLYDFNALVREAAAKALLKIGDARAVDPLIRVLKDEHYGVRQAAAFTLGKLEDVRAVEPLIALLQDTDLGVRRAAVEALGKMRDARAVQPLIALLISNSSGVDTQTIAEALGKLGAPAVEGLIPLLDQDKEELCQVAAEVLVTIGKKMKAEEDGAAIKALGAILTHMNRGKGLYAYAAEAEEKLVKIIQAHTASGDIARLCEVKTLLCLLTGDHAGKLYQAALHALAKFGESAVQPLLAEISNNLGSLAAVEVLMEIDPQRAVQPLIYILTATEYGAVMSSAAEYLGIIGDERAIPALGDYLMRGYMKAASILESFGVAAVRALLPALRHRDGILRQAAARALVHIYQRDKEKMDEKTRQAILAARPAILQSHSDVHEDVSTHCVTHNDHNDQGIGIDFPL